MTPTLNADGSLRLAYAPGATGVGVVTVRATSVFDATEFVEDTFTVTVAAPVVPAVGPNAIIGLADGELIVSRAVGGTFTTAPWA